MADKRGPEVALNSLRKVIDDLSSSDLSGQTDLPSWLLETLSEIADSLSAYQAGAAASAYQGTSKRPAIRSGASGSAEAPEQTYEGIRRFADYIEESIYNGTRWAAFEPNNDRLWSRIRSSVGDLMQELFQQGKLGGRKPERAYFVKCGADTTTQADIDKGVVNIVVGYAPLKGAEFVILRIQQGARIPKLRRRRA